MKLPLPEVVSFDKTTTDFEKWNPMQQSYGTKTESLGVDYPKSLLTCVWEEFCQRCLEYHIDASKYRFCEITDFDGRWQIDFKDHPENKTVISVHSIIFSAKRRAVLQSIFSI